MTEAQLPGSSTEGRGRPGRRPTWELALLWSSRVRHEKFSLGMDGADLEAIRQLVLAGFPTTSTWCENQTFPSHRAVRRNKTATSPGTTPAPTSACFTPFDLNVIISFTFRQTSRQTAEFCLLPVKRSPETRGLLALRGPGVQHRAAPGSRTLSSGASRRLTRSDLRPPNTQRNFDRSASRSD